MTNMPHIGLRRLPDFSAVLTVFGAMVLAVLVGLLAAWLPWLYTLIAVLVPLVLVVSAMRPQIGLVVALMFIFEVVPTIFQPRVPFGGGRLQVYDLLIAYLGAVVLIRTLVAGGRPLHALGPIRWPLYYLFACVLSSLIYVRFFAPNSSALAEARANITWLIVPLIALSADTPSRFRWLVRSVVAIGLVIALYVTIQSTFDLRIMSGSRVEILDQSLNRDVVRSIAGGGIYIVIFALLLLINRMLERSLSWLWGIPASLLLVAGLAVQYGRGVWIAAVIGLLISAALFRGVSGMIRVLLVGIFVTSLVLSAAAVFKPRIAEALISRVTGIGAEIESGGSFNFRKLENDAAIARIEHSPLTGIGLGGEYKQTISLEGSFQNETIYIHNGYLFFPLKMGLFATFVPLAFIVAFFVTVRQGVARNLDAKSDRAFVAALSGAFTVPLVTSVTQPEWSSPQGIAAYAIFMGLALLYRQMGSPLRAVKLTTKK